MLQPSHPNFRCLAWNTKPQSSPTSATSSTACLASTYRKIAPSLTGMTDRSAAGRYASNKLLVSSFANRKVQLVSCECLSPRDFFSFRYDMQRWTASPSSSFSTRLSASSRIAFDACGKHCIIAKRAFGFRSSITIKRTSATARVQRSSLRTINIALAFRVS